MSALTYDLAHAAGWDAGNRSMRAAGRSAWNEADWATACAAMARLTADAGRHRRTHMTHEKCDDCDKPFDRYEKRFTFSKTSPEVEQSFGPYCQNCRDKFIDRVRADGRMIALRHGETREAR